MYTKKRNQYFVNLLKKDRPEFQFGEKLNSNIMT